MTMTIGDLIARLNQLVETGTPLDTPILTTPQLEGVEVLDDPSDRDGPYITFDFNWAAERDE